MEKAREAKNLSRLNDVAVWDSLSSWFRLGPDNRTVSPTRRAPRTTLFWLRPLKGATNLGFDKLQFVDSRPGDKLKFVEPAKLVDRCAERQCRRSDSEIRLRQSLQHAFRSLAPPDSETSQPNREGIGKRCANHL